MKRRVIDYIVIGLKGMAMGAADVVPGVSGGTIAFISGIYEELLETIDGFGPKAFRVWKKQGFLAAWKSINGNFLAVLMLGIATSIITLAKAIQWLLINEPVLLWSFFFGLVLASVIFIGKQISKWRLLTVLILGIISIASYILTFAKPFASPDSHLYLLFCGFIGIIAMILPGISGAFILLILGAYQTVIATVDDLSSSLVERNLDLFTTALSKFLMLAIGAVAGLKVFSRILNWLFKHYRNATLAALTGFMIGSLNKLWPWKRVLSTRINSKGIEVPLEEISVSPTQFDGEPQLLLSSIFMILGILTIVILERLGSGRSNS